MWSTNLFTNITTYNWSSIYEYPDTVETSPSYGVPGDGRDDTRSLRYVAATGVTIFSCLAVIVNLILTYAVTRTKYVPRITRHFFTCLALADLFSAVFTSGFAIYPTLLQQPPVSNEALVSESPGSQAMCKLQAWIFSFTDAVTSYSMMFLSCDRYIAATQPAQYPQIMTSKQSVVTIIANSLVIAGFHIPAFQQPMWRYVPHASMCVPSFWYNWPYVVADGIIFVLIPGSIYLGAYIKLVETVSKPDFGSPHLNSDTALDKDLIQVIGFIGCMFYVSVLPYQVYVWVLALLPATQLISHQQLYSNSAIAALVWFSFIKTIICPIYTCYKYQKFRKKLKKMMTRIRTCGKEEDQIFVLPTRVRRKATTGSIRIRRDSLNSNGPLVISQNYTPAQSAFSSLTRNAEGAGAPAASATAEADTGAIVDCPSSRVSSPQQKKKQSPAGSQTNEKSCPLLNGGAPLQPKTATVIPPDVQSLKAAETSTCKITESHSPSSKRKHWWGAATRDSASFGGSTDSGATLPPSMSQEPSSNPHLKVQRETRQTLFTKPSTEDSLTNTTFPFTPGVPTKVFTTASSHQVLHVVRSIDRSKLTPEMKRIQITTPAPEWDNRNVPPKVPTANSTAFVTSLYGNANLNNSTSSVINITTQL